MLNEKSYLKDCYRKSDTNFGLGYHFGLGYQEASFDEICTAAIAAEGIVIQKELSEDKNLVIANFQSTQLSEQAKEPANKQTQIELLKEQNELLKSINGKNNPRENFNIAATVGVVNSQNQQSGRKNDQSKYQSAKQGTGQSNPNFNNPKSDNAQQSGEKTL